MPPQLPITVRILLWSLMLFGLMFLVWLFKEAEVTAALCCLICRKDTPQRFCNEHCPKFGDHIMVDRQSIYVGTIPMVSVIFDKLMRKRIVKCWVGTDVLLLSSFPPHKGKMKIVLSRMKSRLLKYLVSEYWFVSNALQAELPNAYKRKGVTEQIWPLWGRLEIHPKIDHSGTHILVYAPNRTKFDEWLYGWDIIKELMKRFPDYNWIVVDGSCDMSLLYSIVDFYIRPTRHDGNARMVAECELNEIPVYWSADGKPTVEKVASWLTKEIARKKDSISASSR